MNKSVLLSAVFVMAAFIPAVAFAAPIGQDNEYAFQHPARTLVLYRIERFKWVVGKREAQGDYTRRMADALRAEADGIRGEEELFATQHGGRLTNGEVIRLNNEMNNLDRQLNA